MADVLLNKVINADIEINLFLNWLLQLEHEESHVDTITSCNATRTDFITYFLNYVHEEISDNKYGDTPQKLKTPKRIEKQNSSDRNIVKRRTSLFTAGTERNSVDRIEINKSQSYPTVLNKTLESSTCNKSSDNINLSHCESSTPKITKSPPESFNSSYFSPVSPIYRNQNSFSTPKTKRQLLLQKSTEKANTLCLGDFIVTKKSSTKKKKGEKQHNSCETSKTVTRRINPTNLCKEKLNSTFSQSENSFNFQRNAVEEVPVEQASEQRNFLAAERTKILSRDTFCVTPKKIPQLKTVPSYKNLEVEPDVSLVTFYNQLDLIVQIYVGIINGNLLNTISEIYFLISLLLDKQQSNGLVGGCNRNNVSSTGSNSSADGNFGVAFLNNDDDTNNILSLFTQPKRLYNSEIFESVHNGVYFAVASLERLVPHLVYYDRSTLKLLSQNKRLSLFSPTLAKQLAVISDRKSDRIVELCDVDLQTTNVCFNLDTDNRDNFPNDVSFHAFRKQRDLFYEIIRIWENSHLLAGWNFAGSLGGKIKSLFGLHSGAANCMHFARLFKGQLMSTCGKLQTEEGLSDRQLPFANVDADKLNRLKNRLVTKQTSNGINSLPLFHGHQEFYKEFVVVAAHHTFNRHLCDILIADIVELNDTKFSCMDLADSETDVDPTTRQSFVHCIKSLRVLAKFLGFIEALPYKSENETFSENLLESLIKARFQTHFALNVKELLIKSIKEQNTILTIPWVVKYLAMLDYVTLRLPYYQSVLVLLFNLYQNVGQKARGQLIYNTAVVKLSLGWLFELPHFPDCEFFKFCANNVGGERPLEPVLNGTLAKSDDKMKTIPLDVLEIVDQNILYICCPYLDEIKKLLSSNVAKTSLTVKHITPISDVQSSSAIASKRLELQLEEAFFNGQPVSVRKTVEFVSERIASSCVKHICITVVPAYKKTAREEVSERAQVWKQEHDLLSEADRKEHKLLITTKCNQIATKSLKELQELCESEVLKITKEKLPACIDSLLAIDVLKQTKNVCVSIASKLCVERVSQWLNSHVTIGIFTKDFDGEVQRNLSGCSDAKRFVSKINKPVFALPPGGNSAKHNENSLSAVHLLEKVKLFCVDIVENNTFISEEVLVGILDEASVTLSQRSDVNECIATYICMLLVDCTLLLLSHRPALITTRVLGKFVDVWKFYYGKPDELFKHLLCPRNIMILAQSHNVTKSWEGFAHFVGFLIQQKMLSSDSFETQCTGIFKKEWDPATLTNLTEFFKLFVNVYKVNNNGGDVDKFAILLEFLSDFCVDL